MALFLFLFLTIPVARSCTARYRPTVVFTAFVSPKTTIWRCAGVEVTPSNPLTHYFEYNAGQIACRIFGDFPRNSCVNLDTLRHDGVGGIILNDWEELTVFQQRNCYGESVFITNRRNCIHHGKFDCFNGIFRSVAGPDFKLFKPEDSMIEEIEKCIPQEDDKIIYHYDNTQALMPHEESYTEEIGALEAVSNVKSGSSSNQHTSGTSLEHGSEIITSMGGGEGGAFNMITHQFTKATSMSMTKRIYNRMALHFGSTFAMTTSWGETSNTQFSSKTIRWHRIVVPAGIRTVVKQHTYICGRFQLKTSKKERLDYDRLGRLNMANTHAPPIHNIMLDKEQPEEIKAIHNIIPDNVALSAKHGRPMYIPKRKITLMEPNS